MKQLILVLLFLSVNAVSSEYPKYFGGWSVIQDSDSRDLIAGTTNDSGHVIAFRCFVKTKQCVHVLIADTQCEDGGSYPILINSDFSPLAMESVCSVNGKSHELILTNYDSIHKILETGSYVGVAIPMASGQFKVFRFRLNGSKQAMDHAESTVANMKNDEEYL